MKTHVPQFHVLSTGMAAALQGRTYVDRDSSNRASINHVRAHVEDVRCPLYCDESSTCTGEGCRGIAHISSNAKYAGKNEVDDDSRGHYHNALICNEYADRSDCSCLAQNKSASPAIGENTERHTPQG